MSRENFHVKVFISGVNAGDFKYSPAKAREYLKSSASVSIKLELMLLMISFGEMDVIHLAKELAINTGDMKSLVLIARVEIDQIITRVKAGDDFNPSSREALLRGIFIVKEDDEEEAFHVARFFMEEELKKGTMTLEVIIFLSVYSEGRYPKFHRSLAENFGGVINAYHAKRFSVGMLKTAIGYGAAVLLPRVLPRAARFAVSPPISIAISVVEIGVVVHKFIVDDDPVNNERFKDQLRYSRW